MPHFTSALLTVPGLLCLYRLAMAPVIIALALSEERTLFVVFLCVSFVTDVIDGPIARARNQCTEIGARLDSVADLLTYIAALVGVFHFEYRAVEQHLLIFFVFIASLCLFGVISFVKFGQAPAFHLYSFKINALLQAIMIFYLLVFGFNKSLYYFSMGFGVLAGLEAIITVLIVDKPIADAKSLYSVLDERRRIR
ncbi:MAG: CDP-alcohol phosphatidyltransferase family protein [Nitrospira sp.]